MVPMAVGKNDAIHTSHVEPEALDVAFKNPGIRPGIEQEGARGVAAPGRDGAGKTVRTAAQAASRQTSQTPLPQPRKLILDVCRHRGEVVGHVVDQNQDLDPVCRG